MKRILGRLTKQIATENNLQEHTNKKIVLYDNDRRHCEKRHMQDFPNKQAFHYIMDNLEMIVSDPDDVFYVKRKQTIEYYKFFEDLGITIRIKIEEGNELKMKTMFIVKSTKFNNKVKNRDYDKYVSLVK